MKPTLTTCESLALDIARFALSSSVRPADYLFGLLTVTTFIPILYIARQIELIIFASVITLGMLAGHPCNLLKTKIRAALTRPNHSSILATR